MVRQDSNLGAVALEAERLSIGLGRGSSFLLCHKFNLTRQRAAFHPRSIKAVSPRSIVPKFVTPIPTSSPPLPPPRAPSLTPQTPRAATVTGGAKMTKRMIKNREQLARASNQKRDPATGRFTRAPHGVVVHWPSAASASVGAASITSYQGSRGSPPIPLASAARH
jgi:hypothetical protein